MVALPLVRESNSRLKSLSNPAAVFVGATQGIGLSTLQQYAALTHAPKIYIVGRSEPVGARIIDDLKASNAEGSYVFFKAQISLLESVDEVCGEIKQREKRLDLLFMSPGYLSFGGREGKLLFHTHFILLFLPHPFLISPSLFTDFPSFQKHQKVSTPFSRFATTPAPSSSSVSFPFSRTHLVRALSPFSQPEWKAPSFPTTSNSNITTVFSTAPTPGPR